MPKHATVVKSGTALIVDCKCGAKLQLELDKETKKPILTELQPPQKDDLDYLFGDDDDEDKDPE